MTDYALPTLANYLAPEDRAVLQSLGERQRYADGTLIHHRGDPDVAMAMVVSGTVKLMRVDHDGRQIIMMTATAGQHFADFNTLRKGKRTHNAIAVGETVIDHYPHDVYMQLLEQPAIVKALYIVTALRLGQAVELFDDIRTLSPEVRLAKMLDSMRRSNGGASRLECVQDDLASLIGVSAMTMSKSLKLLKSAGLIDTGYRTVTILDHRRFDHWLEQHTRD